MLQQVASWLKSRVRGRDFEAFQIEVTSRCALRCAMCPRAALAERWPEKDLAWPVFERIARAFPRVEHVHLQGWGEPLLHPRLFDMIEVAKAAGCRVGFTTNGMHLTPEVGRRLLASGLDLLAVSIAGAIKATHERVRLGSSFPSILENVRGFLALRAEQGLRRPKVEFMYLMLKTNIQELPEAVDLSASLGVDELVATNLEQVVTPVHDELKIFEDPARREVYGNLLEEATARARRAKVAFRAYPLDLGEVAVCEAKPHRILYLSHDGWVSPCNYVTLPGQREFARYFGGRPVLLSALRFGNILEQDLEAIWNQADYRAFRQRFAQRRLGAISGVLSGTAQAGGEGEGAGGLRPPAPEPCQTCYKLYGM
jgi:MoaA/NifB/PqqE/SkfB family radical SAM enzyme